MTLTRTSSLTLGRPFNRRNGIHRMGMVWSPGLCLLSLLIYRHMAGNWGEGRLPRGDVKLEQIIKSVKYLSSWEFGTGHNELTEVVRCVTCHGGQGGGVNGGNVFEYRIFGKGMGKENKKIHKTCINSFNFPVGISFENLRLLSALVQA